MELEFLTTEATGLTTPPSPPTFDPRNIGGQRLSPSTERGYFDQHDMIQSQPRFPGPGDPPDVEASPWEHVFHSTGPPTPVTIYPNVNAVAPFLEQDKEIERRSAELIQRPRSSMSISRHFRNSWSSRRLTELSTDHVQRPGSTPPILPGETRVPTKLPDSPGAASARFEPVTTRGKLSLSMWLKKKQMETGVDYSDRPIDVQLERMRREERDTGVIGLTPKEELEVSSLSEESISYAAAVREIAGLERHPKARKRRGSMMKGANEEKGVEVLMG